MNEKQDTATKSEAIKMLHISSKKFDELNVPVFSKSRNQRRKTTNIYHYERSVIESYRIVVEATRKPRQSTNFNTKFEKQYTNYIDALSDVCRYMFELNRLCKPELVISSRLGRSRFRKRYKITEPNRIKIYQLKGLLITYLHKREYCTNIEYSKENLPEKVCHHCYAEGCKKCDYRGILPEKTIHYYCFTFEVNNIFYKWHIPVDEVSFEVNKSEIKETKMPDLYFKEGELPSRKRPEAKALISWFLEKCEKDGVFS